MAMTKFDPLIGDMEDDVQSMMVEEDMLWGQDLYKNNEEIYWIGSVGLSDT